MTASEIVRTFSVCVVEQGYSIAGRVIRRTDKGVQISNDRETLWLPRRHVISERDRFVIVSEWIGDQKLRACQIIDPNGIKDRRRKEDAYFRRHPIIRGFDYDGDGEAP